MPAAESYGNSLSIDEAVVSDIHRSKISQHRAKAGYNYPTIRLPHTFSKLIGLSTQIYLTVREGALAFLVVISPDKKTAKSSEFPALTCRRSADSNNRQPTRDRLSEAEVHNRSGIFLLIKLIGVHQNKMRVVPKRYSEVTYNFPK